MEMTNEFAWISGELTFVIDPTFSVLFEQMHNMRLMNDDFFIRFFLTVFDESENCRAPLRMLSSIFHPKLSKSLDSIQSLSFTWNSKRIKKFESNAAKELDRIGFFFFANKYCICLFRLWLCLRLMALKLMNKSTVGECFFATCDCERSEQKKTTKNNEARKVKMDEITSASPFSPSSSYQAMEAVEPVWSSNSLFYMRLKLSAENKSRHQMVAEWMLSFLILLSLSVCAFAKHVSKR